MRHTPSLTTGRRSTETAADAQKWVTPSFQHFYLLWHWIYHCQGRLQAENNTWWLVLHGTSLYCGNTRWLQRGSILVYVAEGHGRGHLCPFWRSHNKEIQTQDSLKGPFIIFFSIYRKIWKKKKRKRSLKRSQKCPSCSWKEAQFSAQDKQTSAWEGLDYACG